MANDKTEAESVLETIEPRFKDFYQEACLMKETLISELFSTSIEWNTWQETKDNLIQVSGHIS